MIVAIPGVVGEGAETTIAYAVGCCGGPLLADGCNHRPIYAAATGNQGYSHKDRARLNQPLARLA